MEVSALDRNALFPIDVTPGGITTAARQSLPAVTSTSGPVLVMVYFGGDPSVVPVEQEYSPFGGAEAWAGIAKRPVTEIANTATIARVALKRPGEAIFNFITLLRASRIENFAIYGE
jgi:hypothetical protein